MGDQRVSSFYDLIILGASGFTGKYVVKEALKFLNTPSLRTIAIAGRNPGKLSQTLKWAAHPHSPPAIPILKADTTDPSSMRRLCAQTKLLLNCVGPYRLYGQPVVAACAESGCDYLDICGEPDFMERMEAEYHHKAAETGSLVISACGFDSIPAELGFFFNSRQWVGAAAPGGIDAYVSLEPDNTTLGNFGTYESAVLGVANTDELVELRRSIPRKGRPLIVGPNLLNGELVEYQKKIDRWAIKLPSADSTVVRRTLSTIAKNPHGLHGRSESEDHIKTRERFWASVKPAHFGVRLCSESRLGIWKFETAGRLIGKLSQTTFGIWLLLTFPLIFSLGMISKKGPSEDKIQNASFKMWFVGKGYSDTSLVSKGADTEIITRVSGPDIGYVTTPIILLQCALILLSQRDNLPKGGVVTAGVAFGPTDLQKRLQDNGISFDVISKTTFSSSTI